MKNFKKSHSIAGQSNAKMQKSQKHDANLQKNSMLYFQIGLILCLLGTYGLFEMKFEKKEFTIQEIAQIEDTGEVLVKPYTIETDVKIEKQVEQKSLSLVDKPPVIVEDNVVIIENPIVISKNEILNKPIDVGSLGNIEKPDEIIEPPFSMKDVEVVPIYPGCEKATTNRERVKCMSNKLGKLIQRKFNTSLAADLGLFGMQKIDVQFKIDKNGLITEIKTRAPLQQLEDEANRVVNKIPQMTPGKQRHKPVAVLYNLPIKFQVR
ncbi:energy transducer TonB [Psychroserpens ponticola]|uniref:Energy transducer TonB n=1 Tax=Psychroserpens ponticola TaxID=2932268 RepID=A0ABY7RYD7_9FLAO|nr:energy transducer TonB [Psychroserpens ponticola]WCO02043.1 energy transducer TonB [Psychroserpens ponticola]